MTASSATIGTLGNFLRGLRKNRRLTMQEAAQAADINRSTLHRWESGQVQPRLSELEALLHALNASPPQRKQAVALVEAPRARTLVRLELAQMAEQTGLGPLPHGGDLLRAMRLRRGLSLEDVALRVGVTTSTLRRWEKADSWPSVENLHRLCYALEAQSEEMIALTCGQFSRSSLIPDATHTTAQALAEQVERYTQTLYEPPFGLKDLELLTLQQRAWPLASQSARGLRVLANTYAVSSSYLSYRDRYREVIATTERYFEIAPLQSLDGHARLTWMSMHLIATRNSVRVPGLTTPKQRLDELRRLLPLARGTRNEVTALHMISEALLQQGVQEEALQVSAEACQAAQKTQGDERVTWAWGEMGIQLIRCGRYAAGLSLLSTGGEKDWYRLVETSLWKAEALIGLDEKTEAQRWLMQAQADLTHYEMTPLQPRLNALQARLRGELSGESSERS